MLLHGLNNFVLIFGLDYDDDLVGWMMMMVVAVVVVVVVVVIVVIVVVVTAVRSLTRLRPCPFCEGGGL